MTYGHSTRLADENATVQRALVRASGTWGGYQAWRLLDAERRLALVEEALKPTDLIDDFPVAM